MAPGIATTLPGPALTDAVTVDTIPALESFLRSIAPDAILYVDLEGHSLSRHGTLDLMTVLPWPSKTCYIINVHKLGGAAFDTTISESDSDGGGHGHNHDYDHHTSPARRGTSLRRIFQDQSTVKVFWDVRNDSDALFSHHAVALEGILDLQLLEVATATRGFRGGMPDRIVSLDNAVKKDLGISAAQHQGWYLVKERGLNMFKPERGGSFDVFQAENLSTAIVQYCVNDVRLMPALHAEYNRRGGSHVSRRSKIDLAGRERVRQSQAPEYMPNGPNRTTNPFIAMGGFPPAVVRKLSLSEWECDQGLW